MKLKSIKAYGFKSFADKIDIEIKSNITAIVGPNGSGKSNIVDAVKWVLGSQSVKSLRGSSAMTDCIFKGSKTRDALKRAEVSLNFDNSDHELNSDLNEIEVKRVVYHTGENEYFLNNTKVRLKDITDLFLDTGAGLDSFNIIGQGNIETVINSKPEDRRVIFEEAAGVLKYKKRKEESLKKLEKTKDNLEKVGLIVSELENTVLPLKEQSKLAKKYLDLKSRLEELEISFIATDIKNKNEEYQILKNEVESLENKVLELKSRSDSNNSKVEALRLDLLKTEEEITNKNNELLATTEELAKKNSEKDITIERQKYSVDQEKVNENILKLKEEELNLQKQKELQELDVQELRNQLQERKNKYLQIEEKVSLTRIKVNNIHNQKNTTTSEIYNLKNQIDILENNIANDVKIPSSVRNILNNPRLEGVDGIIGKLIEVKGQYMDAIDISLGASSNFIVVESENVAKKAIEYLKENHLGRATFFPRNIIKSRKLEAAIIQTLKREKGYIGIASELISFDEKYRNIIENQLGNIIVVDNMDSMNILGKKMNYKYRIVTLAGEILHTGGSMAGGSMKRTNNSLSDKLELEKKQSNLKDLNIHYEKLTKEMEKQDQELTSFLNERLDIETKLSILQNKLNSKEDSLLDLQNKLQEKQSELHGSKNILENTLDQQLIDILESVKSLELKCNILKKELDVLKNHKSELNSQISNYEYEYREKNSEQNRMEQDLKQKEIRLGKLDIQLDNLLVSLSQNYNMTYEKAIVDHPLEIDYETAKAQVEKLKSDMIRLGNVNLGSIEEYDRLSTRYNFLLEQKNDLESSSENLKQVICEMDEIMKEKFIDTFNEIKGEFSIVFKKLFKGGTGILKLTDPENILETGIDIIAEPPGKKLNNIALLSGGEKTLTAISLLFAILNVKPVPFCILDEVEAALDEANVDTFGAYLQSKKDVSEFILITHKKRTMEYADTLYGITMQESGVSKIVSVELDQVQ